MPHYVKMTCYRTVSPETANSPLAMAPRIWICALRVQPRDLPGRICSTKPFPCEEPSSACPARGRGHGEGLVLCGQGDYGFRRTDRSNHPETFPRASAGMPGVPRSLDIRTPTHPNPASSTLCLFYRLQPPSQATQNLALSRNQGVMSRRLLMLLKLPGRGILSGEGFREKKGCFQVHIQVDQANRVQRTSPSWGENQFCPETVFREKKR